MTKKVTIIGPAIIDVLAGPIGEDIFSKGSMPMQDIKMTYGGNGYNTDYQQACRLQTVHALAMLRPPAQSSILVQQTEL